MLRCISKTPDVFFTSPTFHSRTKRPWKNSQKSLALRRLRPCVRTASRSWAWSRLYKEWKLLGPKRDSLRWDSFGSDFVGLYWLEFSGVRYSSKTHWSDGACWSARVPKQLPRQKLLYMTSNEFLARTWSPRKQQYLKYYVFFLNVKHLRWWQQLDRRGDTGATGDGITRRGLENNVWFWKRFRQWWFLSKFYRWIQNIPKQASPKRIQNIQDIPETNCFFFQWYLSSIQQVHAEVIADDVSNPPSVGTGSSKRFWLSICFVDFLAGMSGIATNKYWKTSLRPTIV